MTEKENEWKTVKTNKNSLKRKKIDLNISDDVFKEQISKKIKFSDNKSQEQQKKLFDESQYSNVIKISTSGSSISFNQKQGKINEYIEEIKKELNLSNKVLLSAQGIMLNINIITNLINNLAFQLYLSLRFYKIVKLILEKAICKLISIVEILKRQVNIIQENNIHTQESIASNQIIKSATMKILINKS